MSYPEWADRILRHAHVIREPPGVGQGYWAGAPGAAYARDEKVFYLTYRLRRPRGVPPDRGGEARIARSTDLRHFEDVWSVTKEAYGSVSIVLSVAMRTPRTRDESHATLDILNTGDCVSATALARSVDFESWEWLGVVFAPSPPGWDAYCRRINSIVRRGGEYVALYDGSASHLGNYEETIPPRDGS